jgi:hypothetical protein
MCSGEGGREPIFFGSERFGREGNSVTLRSFLQENPSQVLLKVSDADQVYARLYTSTCPDLIIERRPGSTPRLLNRRDQHAESYLIGVHRVNREGGGTAAHRLMSLIVRLAEVYRINLALF